MFLITIKYNYFHYLDNWFSYMEERNMIKEKNKYKKSGKKKLFHED